MSSIKKLADNKWRARYRTPEGASRSKTCKSRGEAKAFLVKVDHDQQVGGFVDPALNRKVTFKTYAAKWQAAQPHGKRSATIHDGRLRNHVFPVLGDRPLVAIRQSEIQTLVTDLRKQYAHNTVKGVLQTIRAVFNMATADRVIRESPASGVRLPRPPKVEIVPPTTEQVQTVLGACPGRYRAAVTLMAASGIRLGELLGLDVHDINYIGRTVTIRQQLTDIGEIGPPKTEASYRTIPLPQFAVDAVAQHLTEYEPAKDGGLWTNEQGARLAHSTFRDRCWDPATAGALTWIKPHDLRHHYVSVLIAAGESVKVIQKRVGHQSATVTWDTYGHLFPDSDGRTRDAIEAAFGAACVTPVSQAGANTQ
jgi:integrase